MSRINSYLWPKEVYTVWPHRITIAGENKERLEHWCVTNGICNDKFDIQDFKSMPFGDYYVVASFAQKSDATLFKLRWA